MLRVHLRQPLLQGGGTIRARVRLGHNGLLCDTTVEALDFRFRGRVLGANRCQFSISSVKLRLEPVAVRRLSVIAPKPGQACLWGSKIERP